MSINLVHLNNINDFFVSSCYIAGVRRRLFEVKFAFKIKT